MNNEEKMQKIIAAYTPFDYTKIDLNKAIKDKYIAAEFKDNFCADICDVWKNVNSTTLRNNMFVTLKSGNDIVKILNFVIA